LEKIRYCTSAYKVAMPIAVDSLKHTKVNLKK